MINAVLLFSLLFVFLFTVLTETLLVISIIASEFLKKKREFRTWVSIILLVTYLVQCSVPKMMLDGFCLAQSFVNPRINFISHNLRINLSETFLIKSKSSINGWTTQLWSNDPTQLVISLKSDGLELFLNSTAWLVREGFVLSIQELFLQTKSSFK